MPLAGAIRFPSFLISCSNNASKRFFLASNKSSRTQIWLFHASVTGMNAIISNFGTSLDCCAYSFVFHHFYHHGAWCTEMFYYGPCIRFVSKMMWHNVFDRSIHRCANSSCYWGCHSLCQKCALSFLQSTKTWAFFVKVRMNKVSF